MWNQGNIHDTAILAINDLLQYILDKLVEAENNYGKQINIEKTKYKVNIKKEKKCLNYNFYNVITRVT